MKFDSKYLSLLVAVSTFAFMSQMTLETQALAPSGLYGIHRRHACASKEVLAKTDRHKASRSDNDGEDASSRNGIRQSLASLFSRVVPMRPENSKTEFEMLKQENQLLRRTITQLEIENKSLKRGNHSPKIVIETFEGEGKLRRAAALRNTDVSWFPDADLEKGSAAETNQNDGLTLTGEELEATRTSFVDKEDEVLLWCDELESGSDTCPIEPDVSFSDALRDRAYWLVGLLALQSCSGLILSHNEQLLQAHPFIVYFLTMLVGAGGNAGNQASVRVIRGIALGTLNDSTQGQFLQREFRMALSLSLVLSLAGFTRAILFSTPMAETIAVTAALAMIVFSSVCLGAILPLLLKRVNVDPAHSSTTIQVVMDILGVLLTVLVSTTVLDSPLGRALIAKLSS